MKPFYNYFFLTIALFWSAPTISEAKISARIEYACFPSESGGGRMFLIFGIDGKSLTYNRMEDGSFQASATFAISVNDSVHNFFGEKMDFVSPSFKDLTSRAQEFITTKTIPLPSGKFTIQILAFDAFSSDTARARISMPFQMGDGKNSLVASDLCLLSSGGFDNSAPIFNQDARNLRLSDFYSASDSVLSFYGEIVGMRHKLSKGQSFLSRYRILEPASRKSKDEFGKIKRMKFNDDLAFKADLDIRLLESGNYLLVWDLIDSAGKILVKTEKPFQKSNPGVETAEAVRTNPSVGALEENIEKMSLEQSKIMVASLLPIATKSEQPTIDYLRKKGTEKEVKSYLNSFWPKHEPENPAQAMAEYQQRMDYGAKYYSTKTMPAYQTDRGRVFLQYGKPNLIENEYSDRFRKAMQNLNTIPYEVWYYYKLDKPVKQSDIIFVFVQENRGNENYRLLHSTGIGEVRNREWRKSVENNATYNFDRLDPNDRYDAQDSKKFR